jgi:putative inorganic carbon (HCO3(-)) transporter
MRDVIILLVVLGSIPFIFMRPQVGVMMWSWLAYMNPHRLAWGFAYNFPFSMLIGVVTLIAVLFSKQPKKIPITPVTVVLMMLIFWMILSTFFCLNCGSAWNELIRTMKIQLMTIVMLMMITQKDDLQKLIWVIVGSLGFFGFKGGLFVLATGGSYKVWGPEGSFVEDNNALALALLMIVPLMYYLMTQVEKKWLKIFMILAMVLTLFSVIASYSRGAMLAGVAIGLVLWWKSKRKVIIGAVIVTLALGLLAFMPDKWMDRMNTLQNVEEDGSAMGRVNAWWFAFNLANDRPLTGGGFQTYTPQLFYKYAPIPDDFHDAHSIYFEMLAEQGYVGLFMFLLLLFLAFRTGSWLIKQTRDIPELKWAGTLGAMIQVSLVGYGVGGAFLGLAYYDLPYNLIALVVIAQVIVKRELKRIAEEKGVATKAFGQAGVNAGLSRR